MGKKGRRRKGASEYGGGAGAGGGVSESSRIKISKRLEDFRLSNSDVYTFEADISKSERAEVHTLCRKMGMISRSSGRGDGRSVSVYKTRQKKFTVQGAANNPLTFSSETRQVLGDLFANYTPEAVSVEEIGRSTEEQIKKGMVFHDSTFCKPEMSKKEIVRRIQKFENDRKELPQLQKIATQTSKLPIASFKEVITSSVESNQVVLISGETGCGKTTQVPQYLLAHMWNKRQKCKIVCTQPRRISAVSVAERISTERGENVGETIGYKIRLESKGGKHSSIMFCTNGVLLRLLIGMGTVISGAEDSPSLSKASSNEITHIIVDEIHERDHFADLMLSILREQLPFMPDLRLILMSTTLDVERFSQYFDGCPIIRVPGFTYPVESLLPDITNLSPFLCFDFFHFNFQVEIYYLEHVLSVLQSSRQGHFDEDAACVKEKLTSLSDEYVLQLDEATDLALSEDELDPLLEFLLMPLLECLVTSIL